MTIVDYISVLVFFLSLIFLTSVTSHLSNLHANAETLLKRDAARTGYMKGYNCALDGYQEAEQPDPPQYYKCW